MLAVSALLPIRAQINTDAVIEVGSNALYFEDYLLAIQYFNQVITAKPYLPKPYYLRAIAKYSLDDYAGAEADASKAIDLNPFMPEAWEVRGVARQCLGRNDEAAADYSHALQLLPFNRQLLFNKALAEDDGGMEADSTYAVLLREYPAFDSGYVGRAQMLLHRGDTIAARVDIDHALELNPRSVQALTLRANITDDPRQALTDIDRAVTMQPDKTYLRVMRSIARYNAGNLNGAMDDLNWVLQLEPLNYAALFNRAMLRTEMSDNDRALGDLNRLLQLRPGEPRALFNRAVVLADKHEYERALADADAVVDAYPQMYAAYALRADILRRSGNEKRAAADIRRANYLAHRPADPSAQDTHEPDNLGTTANRFRTLIAMEDEAAESVEQTFNTSGLRGRIQDRSAHVEMLPLYQLSYYHTDDYPTAYVRQVNQLNADHALPYVVYVTNSVPRLSRQSDTERHFAELEALRSLPAPTPLDLFAQAMALGALRDYRQAVGVLDRVIERQPDFAPAYLQRAAMRVLDQQTHRGETVVVDDPSVSHRLSDETAMTLRTVLDDIDYALQLDPLMAVAHYNRGTLLLMMGADADAIDALTRAIEIEPSFGAAYFNRGYARYARGNRDGAESDISRAGQLGISQAYNLLKRMQQ